MGSFDFFAIDVICPECGTEHAAYSATNCQTKIRTNMGLDMLGVGTKLDLYFPITDCGYIEVIAPDKPDSFTLIESWECAKCSGYQWSLIEIKDAVISSGRAIVLTEDVIESVNYATDDINDIGWEVKDGNALHGVD